MKSETEKLVDEVHAEVMRTPLKDFLNEASDIGYSYFFKDIIKKVVVARLAKRGFTKD